jgi:hypothetical protein
MTLEDRIINARAKLAPIRHLLSQYAGQVEFTDEAVHGLALILDEIDADLEPLVGAPRAIGDWEPKGDA